MNRVRMTAVLGGLVVAIAAVSQEPPERVAWAQRVIHGASFNQTRELSGSAPSEALQEVNAAYRAWLIRHPDDGEARFLLGRCQLLLGMYPESLSEFQAAAGLLADGSDARELAQTVIDRLAAIFLLEPMLPGTGQVLRIDPFSIGTKQGWLVLTGEKKPGHLFYFDSFSNLRLHWMVKSDGRYRLAWQSGVLTIPQLDITDFNDIMVGTADVTGDGTPDITVLKVLIGASWLPSHLNVFQYRDGTMREILSSFASMPHWARDYDHDGRVEFVAQHEIGVEPPHVAQPRWDDIYAFNGKRYTIANTQFPQQFTKWPAELKATIARYPRDWELWKYLGVSYEVLGRKAEAVGAYRKALAYCNDPKAKTVLRALSAAMKRGGDSDAILDHEMAGR